MADVIVKKIDRPDETRSFEKGRTEILHLGEGTVGRAVFEPGWKWSECVKPVAGTESCEMAHLGVVQSGRMHVRMDDGQEAEMGPGDVFTIAPGHDAWIVGDEPFVALDFVGAAHFAQREAEEPGRPAAPPSQPSAH